MDDLSPPSQSNSSVCLYLEQECEHLYRCFCLREAQRTVFHFHDSNSELKMICILILLTFAAASVATFSEISIHRLPIIRTIEELDRRWIEAGASTNVGRHSRSLDNTH